MSPAGQKTCVPDNRPPQFIGFTIVKELSFGDYGYLLTVIVLLTVDFTGIPKPLKVLLKINVFQTVIIF